jgi:hypothetical protein
MKNGVVLTIEGAFGSFDLHAAGAQPGKQAFRQREGVAYSYERLTLDGDLLRAVDLLIPRVHRLLRAALLGVSNTPDPRPGALPVIDGRVSANAQAK